MNDIMFEPRCPKCKDLGWLYFDDYEYPCDCRVELGDLENDARDHDEDLA